VVVVAVQVVVVGEALEAVAVDHVALARWGVYVVEFVEQAESSHRYFAR